jgi:hypothetical protein
MITNYPNISPFGVDGNTHNLNIDGNTHTPHVTITPHKIISLDALGSITKQDMT